MTRTTTSGVGSWRAGGVSPPCQPGWLALDTAERLPPRQARRADAPRSPRRGGFTLVELLVVMSLVIVLAGLTVAVAESGAFGSQKVVSASDRAAGWLLIARNRALRDGKPCGVRFLLTADAAGNLTSREAQYIEVPEAWTPDRTRPIGQRAFLAFVYQQQAPGGGLFPNTWISPATYSRSTATPNGQRVLAVFPNAAEGAEFLQRVAAGSLLTLPSTGATFRIDQIIPGVPVTVGGFPAGTTGYDLVLGQNTQNPGPPYFPTPGAPLAPTFTYPDLGAANTPAPVTAAPQVTFTEYNFAFTAGFSGGSSGVGGPQPLVGEPLLQLTGNTVIDVRSYPSSGPNTTFASRPGTGTDPAVCFPTSAGVTVSGTAGNQFFDVLFAPSGQVLGASDGLICLWVRDPDKTPGGSPRYYPNPLPAPEGRTDTGGTQGFDTAGEQKLVTVYTRTGLIATHEILPPPADPYTTARDGLNSGL